MEPLIPTRICLDRLPSWTEPHQAEFAQLAARLIEHPAIQGPEAIVPAAVTPAPNTAGLPDALKRGIEELSGVPMDGVRVHYNSSEPDRFVTATFAQGDDIHIPAGQQRHLPHAAWHVVQQVQGCVQPTIQRKSGSPVNDDSGLEHEADSMGARAMMDRSDPATQVLEPQTNTDQNPCIAVRNK